MIFSRRKITSIVLSLALAVTGVIAGTSTAFASPQSAGMYMKQMGRGYCTLASATMMVRSEMYNQGNTSWPNVTQQKMKGTAWRGGLLHSFNYYGVKVRYRSGGCNTPSALINLLKQHPEGIEIYSRSNPKHAVFLTRYDASTGTFYVADPVHGYETTLASSWFGRQAGGQAGIIKRLDCYWYVAGYSAQTVPGGKVGEVASSAVQTEDSGKSDNVVYQKSTVKLANVNDYSTKNYTDITSSDWYAASVKSAYEMGLMYGMTPTEFSADGNVTIAQAISMAARIRSLYNKDGYNFAAAEGEAWYTPYVEYAVANNMIASKYDKSRNTSLDYNAPILRVQFAEIMSSALPDSQMTQIKSVNTVSDVPRYSGESRYDAVYKLYEAGIIVGRGDVFGTWKTITRAESAAIITRIADASQRIA